MDDVAKKASVSIATVSRVYTNPDKVSLKNRQKVFKAIEELNYQPNVLARNLRRLQTNTILVIIAVRRYEPVTQARIKLLHLLQQKLVDGVILLFPRLELELLVGNPVVRT